MPDNWIGSKPLSDLDHKQRADLRDMLSKRFAEGRDNSAVGSHNQAYARVRGLMASDKLFDIEQESQKMRDRYGPTQFGQQALVARRLVEAGVPFVKVSRAWWDSHGQNFETHLELVPELDHVMSTLLDDLGERGLLENTLVVTLGEFGRTPRHQRSARPRPLRQSAWSTSLTGCGIQGGAVYGKTDADGKRSSTAKSAPPNCSPRSFAPSASIVTKEYHVGARPIPLTDPGTKPVQEVLDVVG